MSRNENLEKLKEILNNIEESYIIEMPRYCSVIVVKLTEEIIEENSKLFEELNILSPSDFYGIGQGEFLFGVEDEDYEVTFNKIQYSGLFLGVDEENCDIFEIFCKHLKNTETIELIDYDDIDFDEDFDEEY